MIVNQQLIVSTEGDAFRFRRERGSGVSTNVDLEIHTMLSQSPGHLVMGGGGFRSFYLLFINIHLVHLCLSVTKGVKSVLTPNNMTPYIICKFINGVIHLQSTRVANLPTELICVFLVEQNLLVLYLKKLFKGTCSYA